MKVQPEARRFALTSGPHKAALCRTAFAQSFLGGLRGRGISLPARFVCKAQVEFGGGLFGGAMQGEQGVYPVRDGAPPNPAIRAFRPITGGVASFGVEAHLVRLRVDLADTKRSRLRAIWAAKSGHAEPGNGAREQSPPVSPSGPAETTWGTREGKNIRWESRWCEKFPRPDGEGKSPLEGGGPRKVSSWRAMGAGHSRE